MLDRVGELERVVGLGMQEREDADQTRSDSTLTSHRPRKQASSGCDLAARSQQAMAACCGTHRRLSEEINCALPSACPTMSCATVFGSFLTDCRASMVAGGLDVADFDRFNTQCGELLTQSASYNWLLLLLLLLLLLPLLLLPPPPPPPK